MGLVPRPFRPRKVRLGGVPHPQPSRPAAQRRGENPAGERYANGTKFNRVGRVPAASDLTLTQSGGGMERVLITGVGGFIGSHLAAELLRQGWSVTGLDARSPASDPLPVWWSCR